MYRKFAVATLLGAIQARGDAETGQSIAAGFIDGSGTGVDFDLNCVKNHRKIVEAGEDSIVNFKKADLNDAIVALQDLSKLVDLIMESKKDCGRSDVDWDQIEKFSNTWHTPLTFAYHEGSEINING